MEEVGSGVMGVGSGRLWGSDRGVGASADVNREFKVLLKEHQFIQDITCMHFLLVCKFKKFISNREKVDTFIFLDFQRQLTL